MLKIIGGVVIGGVILLGLCFFLFVGGLATMFSAKASANASDNGEEDTHTAIMQKRAIRVDAFTLESAYRSNEVAADARFKGKVLEVAGIVTAIRKDFLDNPIIELAGGDRLSTVDARLAKGQESSAAHVEIGSAIAVRCVGGGYTVEDAQLEDCVIESGGTMRHPEAEPASSDTQAVETKTATASAVEHGPSDAWPLQSLGPLVADALVNEDMEPQADEYTALSLSPGGTESFSMRLSPTQWTLVGPDKTNSLLRASGELHIIGNITNGYSDLLVESPLMLRVYQFDGTQYLAKECYARGQADDSSPISKVDCNQ